MAIPGLSLNQNTTNPQKKLASLLCKAPLAEKLQVMVWNDIINNSINSHRTNKYRACTAEEVTEILMTLTGISAILYFQYTRYQEPADQLVFSCHSYYEVFKEEEKKGAGQRISGTAPGYPAGAKVFADCVRTPRHPASSFVRASFKHEKQISIENEGGKTKTGEQRRVNCWSD